MKWRCASTSLAIALSTGACLVETNPKFTADGGSELGDTDPKTTIADSTGGTDSNGSDTEPEPEPCPPGTLDCDDTPDCEADADDPMTCGACDHSCVFGDQALDCTDGLCSGTLVFEVQHDTYADSLEPMTVLGDASNLEVDTVEPDQHTYIALPDITDLPAGLIVEAAALNLECTNIGDPTGVYQVTMDWLETELTWANAPTLNPTPQTMFSPTLGETTLDLTPLLPSWRVQPNFSIAMVSTANDGLTFRSSETATGPWVSMTVSW